MCVHLSERLAGIRLRKTCSFLLSPSCKEIHNVPIAPKYKHAFVQKRNVKRSVGEAVRNMFSDMIQEGEVGELPLGEPARVCSGLWTAINGAVHHCSSGLEDSSLKGQDH